jgi:hypothetical protein
VAPLRNFPQLRQFCGSPSSAGSITLRGMARKRQPIDDMIDAHVWMRRQETRLNRRCGEIAKQIKPGNNRYPFRREGNRPLSCKPQPTAPASWRIN